MYMIDFGEKDGIFNYIDWNTIRLMCWSHIGHANFFSDYHGNNLFLKMHGSPYHIDNISYNWENPFIFYDYDNDGLTEFTIRLVDTPNFRPKNGYSGIFDDIDDKYEISFTKKIDWVAFSWDLDNDNTYGKEFDFDMSVHFRGEGFDYSDQKHTFNSLKGLESANKLLWDDSWRKNVELIYADQNAAFDLVFGRGNNKYNESWFVFDEDDDCNRWERVEFYEPKDLYTIGLRKGGIDNNAQSDAIGDRGEWDLDNSGNGNLYISKFDGRIHLYGAEWGCWRIDQTAYCYQGFGGLYDKWAFHRMTEEPEIFGLVKYTDTDKNGFIDLIEYDLDGNQDFEEKVSLIDGKLVKSSSHFGGKEYREQGIYDFEELPLGEVLERLEQWYDIHFTVDDPSLLSKIISGKFRQSDQIETILKAISRADLFEYKILSQREITIY